MLKLPSGFESDSIATENEPPIKINLYKEDYFHSVQVGHCELYFEQTELWGMQDIQVVHITFQNTGFIPNHLLHGLTILGVSECQYKDLQKSVILSSVRPFVLNEKIVMN